VTVLALSGPTVDRLPVLGVLAALGVLAVALLSRAPRLAFAGWLAAVCFVPVWVGITVKVSLEPHVLASLGLVVCLLVSFVSGRGRGLAPGRVTWGDGLFVAFVVASLVPALVGRTGFSDMFVLLVQWTAAFLAGRLIGYRVPLPWVHGAIAVAFTVVSVFALVEFLTHWNPFVLIPGSDSLHATWSPIQDRGGRARAEGAFGHSIALGACLAIAVPITLTAPFRTWLRMVMVGVVLGASVVTFSRIGLVTAVLGVALAVVFLPSGLSARVRAAVVGSLVVVAGVSASLVSEVFAAAGAEASDSAGYRLSLLHLVPDLVPFGYASSAYRLATGQLVLANIPTSDGILQSVDNALLLLGLTYGWVPMAVVLAGLLVAVGCVLARWVTAPTIALVAQIPAFATVALITQYSTVTWFVAGLAVFSQSVLRAPRPGENGGDPAPPHSPNAAQSSPEMVGDDSIKAVPALP
jgi:hypothetical protein